MTSRRLLGFVYRVILQDIIGIVGESEKNKDHQLKNLTKIHNEVEYSREFQLTSAFVEKVCLFDV